jgi:hypothetical protein
VTQINIIDDGDIGTVSWCNYVKVVSKDSCHYDVDRMLPTCDCLSNTYPSPREDATSTDNPEVQTGNYGRFLKKCDNHGFTCNKLPNDVTYFYTVAEGEQFDVAFNRFSKSGFDYDVQMRRKHVLQRILLVTLQMIFIKVIALTYPMTSIF